MPNTSKSSKKASPANGAAAVTEFVDAFTPLYLNGVERMAELQKKALDLAAEQTSKWMGAWKKAFSFFPVAPPTVDFRNRRTGRPNLRRNQQERDRPGG